MTTDKVLELRHKASKKLAAAETLADVITDALFDNASGFTCSEAEAIREFLRLFSDANIARNFLEAHADSDGESDLHFGYRAPA